MSKQEIQYIFEHPIYPAFTWEKKENPLKIKRLNKLHVIHKSKTIIFCWIPSHIGNKEEDKVDPAAKSVSEIVISNRYKSYGECVYQREMATTVEKQFTK